MAEQTPLKALFDGSGNPTSLAEFTVGDFVRVADGGTGVSSYSSGQLLIGNSSNGLTAATITGTSNQITVTNGDGSIVLSLPQNIHTTATPTFGRIGLGTSPSRSLHISCTDGIVLPVGTTAQRVGTPIQGEIRFNTTDTAFEGYDGSAWGALGGGAVQDADEDTYISAEVGSDNDELRFFTAGSERMRISNVGNVALGGTPSATTNGRFDVCGTGSTWIANFLSGTSGWGITIGNKTATAAGYATHIYWSGVDNGYGVIQPYSFTNSAARNLVLVPDGGCVGIGTALNEAGIRLLVNGATHSSTCVKTPYVCTGNVGFGTNTVSGVESIVVGNDAQATANCSITLGSCSCSTADKTIAGGYFTCATGEDSSAVGNYAKSLGVHSSAFGSIASSCGNCSIAVGRVATACGVCSSVFGIDSDAQGTKGVVVGFEALQLNNVSNSQVFGTCVCTLAEHSTAIGTHTCTGSSWATAVGYSSATDSAANYSSVFGSFARVNVACTVNIGGAVITKKDSGETTGGDFLQFAGTETTLMTKEIDLKTAACHTMTIPTNAKFWVNEMGVISTNISAMTTQPTIKIGCDDTNTSTLMASLQTVELTTENRRERYLPATPERGLQTITVEIATGATATTACGRFYFKGMLVENE